MPNSAALGLLWDVESNALSAKCKRAMNEVTSGARCLVPF